MFDKSNHEYPSLRHKIAAESKLRTERYEKFNELWIESCTIGLSAGRECQPKVMVVEMHTDPIDDDSKVIKQYVEPAGVCGFAWILIRPANCSFVRWLIKNKFATVAYHGGVSIWISDHNQSMERKRKHASAMCASLVAGLKTLDPKCKLCTESRMD